MKRGSSRGKDQWAVSIKVVKSLNGKSTKEFVEERLRQMPPHSIFVLIDPERSQIEIQANEPVGEETIRAWKQAMEDRFREGQFDRGVIAFVRAVQEFAGVEVRESEEREKAVAPPRGMLVEPEPARTAPPVVIVEPTPKGCHPAGWEDSFSEHSSQLSWCWSCVPPDTKASAKKHAA
jgi:hypothetical protein